MLLAQGPLSPPGAPSATGRSLDQIEPRVPIPVAGPFPYTITQKGSYYLTGNVSVASGNAIVIQSGDVTLDLSGFTIASTSATLSGIAVALDGSGGVGLNNVSIANGFIRGTSNYQLVGGTVTGGGFATGIGEQNVFGGGEGSVSATGVRVSSLGVSGVGDGIRLNPNSPSNVVEKTTVASVQGVGIRAGVVADSSADRTGGVSIEARSASNIAGSRYTAGSAILPATLAPLTRADVEPRTAIPGGTTTHTISASGSYVLTGNLTVSSGDGILITADNVTLDLNGYTISSTANPSSGFGVKLSGVRTNVAISNGHIRGTRVYSSGSFSGGGFFSGIEFTGGAPRSARVSNVSVTGVAAYGINLGADRSSSITGSTVRTADLAGMQAGSISDSAALEVGGLDDSAVTAGSVSNVFASVVGGGSRFTVADPTVLSVSGQVTAVQAAVGAVQSAVAVMQADVSALRTRTVINAGGASVITTPGSYVLAGDITVASGSGITVTADNVSIDLNGYSVVSTGAVNPNAAGVLLSGGRSRIAISNGFIRGIGFSSGITFTGGTPSDVRVSSVSISGTANFGISLLTTTSSVVTGCTVSTVASVGIVASTVVGCSVADSGSPAIQASTVASSFGAVIDTKSTSNDPRTAITGGTGKTISAAGSYYLTGNIAVTSGIGVLITADNVTLDLNGFTISSSETGSGSGSGVYIGTRKNVTVRNGRIRGAITGPTPSYGPGNFVGIDVRPDGASVRIENVTISNVANGIIDSANINLANFGDETLTVIGCTVNVARGIGIDAPTVRNCVATSCGDFGIRGNVVIGCVGDATLGTASGGSGIIAVLATDCRGTAANASGFGLSATTATNCIGTNGNGLGLNADVALNSRGVAFNGPGLKAAKSATGCFGRSEGGVGLESLGTAAQCRGETGTGTGLKAVIAIGCTASADAGGTALGAIGNRYLMP